MVLSPLRRIAFGLASLAALGACASTEPQTAMRAAPVPEAATLRTVEASPAVRQRAAREAQLQTPLELAPEATGAPPAHHFHDDGLDVSAAQLQAAGVDISPDTRVWQRWPAGTRQIYGPRATSTNPILRPIVVAPQ